MEAKARIDRISGLVSRLIDIQDCATGKRFPFWDMVDRPRLMSEEIETLIDELQADDNLVIS